MENRKIKLSLFKEKLGKYGVKDTGDACKVLKELLEKVKASAAKEGEERALKYQKKYKEILLYYLDAKDYSKLEKEVEDILKQLGGQ